MSSLILSNPLRRPSRVSMVAFSVEEAFLLHLFPTRCSRLISDRHTDTFRGNCVPRSLDSSILLNFFHCLFLEAEK
jgi:hypothetical protein